MSTLHFVHYRYILTSNGSKIGRVYEAAPKYLLFMRSVIDCKMGRYSHSYIQIRVHTHKFVLNSRTFQRNQKDSLMVFKGYKFMKNTDLQVKILLQKC